MGSGAIPFRNASSASAAETFLFADHPPSFWFLPVLPLLSCLFLPHLPTVGLGFDRTPQKGKKESLLPSTSNGRSFLTYFIPYYFDILKLKQDRLALGPAEQHLPLIAGHCTAPAVLPRSLYSVAVLGVYWKQLQFQAAHSTDGPLWKSHTAMKSKEKWQQQQNLWATQSERLLSLTSNFCSKTKQKPQNVLPCPYPSNLILLPCLAQHCPLVVFLHRNWWNSNWCELICIVSVTKFCEWCWRVFPLPFGNSKQYLTSLYRNHTLDVQQDSELGKTFGRAGKNPVLQPWQDGQLLFCKTPGIFTTQTAAPECRPSGQGESLAKGSCSLSAGCREARAAREMHAGPEQPCLRERSGDMSWERRRGPWWHKTITEACGLTQPDLPRTAADAGEPQPAAALRIPWCWPAASPGLLQHDRAPPACTTPELLHQPAPVPLWEGPGFFGRVRRYSTPPASLYTIIWLGQPAELNLSFTGMTYLFNT